MRNLLVALLLAATLGGGALALSSCGAEDAAGVDVARAAEATRKQGTARMRMTVRMTGLGLPAPITIAADGVTHLSEPRARMRIDFARLMALAGAPRGSGTEMEMLIDGAQVHVRPPKLQGLSIPGGKPWVAVDLAALARGIGLPTEGLGDVFTLDPAAQLRVMKSTKGLEEVGEEQIDGVRTRHFKGSYRLSDAIAALPEPERSKARKAFDALERLAGADADLDEPQETELWVDDAGVLRRMRGSSDVPAQQGVPAGKFATDFRLRDFGAKLDATAPSASETYDATGALRDLIGSTPR